MKRVAVLFTAAPFICSAAFSSRGSLILPSASSGITGQGGKMVEMGVGE